MTIHPWEPDHLFHRQAHPGHVIEGVPSSQAFNPTPKDAGLLSVDDAQLMTAQQSWRHFTASLGFQSAGTWAVSAGEIAATEKLEVFRDPVEDTENPVRSNPAHCVVSFNRIESKGERKRRAQQLAIRAAERGCLFRPA